MQYRSVVVGHRHLEEQRRLALVDAFERTLHARRQGREFLRILEQQRQPKRLRRIAEGLDDLLQGGGHGHVERRGPFVAGVLGTGTGLFPAVLSTSLITRKALEKAGIDPAQLNEMRQIIQEDASQKKEEAEANE